MDKVLYVLGVLIAILGVVLVVPSMTRAASGSDVLVLLSAPIVSNGITLIVSGATLVALGRIVSLVDRIFARTNWLFATDGESKVLVTCPKCSQQLRLPANRAGVVSCPNCSTKFNTKT